MPCPILNKNKNKIRTSTLPFCVTHTDNRMTRRVLVQPSLHGGPGGRRGGAGPAGRLRGAGRHGAPGVAGGASCQRLTNTSLPQAPPQGGPTFHLGPAEVCLVFRPSLWHCRVVLMFPAPGFVLLWDHSGKGMEGGGAERSLCLAQRLGLAAASPCGCSLSFLRPKGKETGHRGVGREPPHAVPA